jgi:dolichyl-phosphate-mannose--protein O-mannosyl transferase
MSSRIYFLGNPFIWWLSTVAIFYGLILWLSKIFYKFKGVNIESPFPFIIIAAFLLNLLPFIGISRAMFLYHYLIGLILAILALAYIIDKIKFNKQIGIAMIAIAVISFVFFAPLSYGTSLTEKNYSLRAWFSSWK